METDHTKQPAYRPSAFSEHFITSAFVAQTFRIYVMQPISRSDGTERFPVVYMPDGDELFSTMSKLALLMQGSGDTPRFIVVGIGYEDSSASALLRMRDLCTHANRACMHPYISQIIGSPYVSGTHDLKTITETTDASSYLQFICEELIPFIDGHYPTITDENTYFGYSAGGGFGTCCRSTLRHSANPAAI